MTVSFLKILSISYNFDLLIIFRQNYGGRKWKVPDYSRLFPIIPDCSRLFPIIPDCSRLFPIRHKKSGEVHDSAASKKNVRPKIYALNNSSQHSSGGVARTPPRIAFTILPVMDLVLTLPSFFTTMCVPLAALKTLPAALMPSKP